MEKYVASEVDQNAIKCSKRNHPEILQVGDVRNITEENLAEWGPFDLMGKLDSPINRGRAFERRRRRRGGG